MHYKVESYRLAARFKLLLVVLLGLMSMPHLFSDGELPRQLWRFPTGGRIPAVPVFLPDNRIIFTSEDRYLYCLSPEGDLLWKSRIPYKPGNHLTLGPDGLIYFTTLNNRLYAYNLSGLKVWDFKLSSSLAANPLAPKDGLVYLLQMDGNITAVNHRGSMVWSTETRLPVQDFFTISKEGILFYSTTGGMVHALYPWGKERNSFLPAGPLYSFFITDQEEIFLSTSKGTVAAFNKEGSFMGDISIGDNRTMIFPLEEQQFLTINKAGGLNRLSRDFEQTSNRSRNSGTLPVSINNPRFYFPRDYGAYIIDENHRIYDLSMEDKVLKSTRLTGDVPVHYNAQGEYLVYGTSDWNVYFWLLKQGADTYPSHSRIDGRLSGGASQSDPDTAYRLYSPKPDNWTLLEQLANTEDRYMKIMALKTLEEKIEEGTDYNYYYRQILYKLTTEALYSPVRRGRIIENDYPDVRIKSLELLARIGNFSTVEMIMNYLPYEWNSSVSGTGFAVLGHLGGGSDRCRKDFLETYLRRNYDYDSNAELASGLLIWLEAVFLYQGELLADEYEILLKISEGDLPRSLRARALKLL